MSGFKVIKRYPFLYGALILLFVPSSHPKTEGITVKPERFDTEKLTASQSNGKEKTTLDCAREVEPWQNETVSFIKNLRVMIFIVDGSERHLLETMDTLLTNECAVVESNVNKKLLLKQEVTYLSSYGFWAITVVLALFLLTMCQVLENASAFSEAQASELVEGLTLTLFLVLAINAIWIGLAVVIRFSDLENDIGDLDKAWQTCQTSQVERILVEAPGVNSLIHQFSEPRVLLWVMTLPLDSQDISSISSENSKLFFQKVLPEGKKPSPDNDLTLQDEWYKPELYQELAIIPFFLSIRKDQFKQRVPKSPEKMYVPAKLWKDLLAVPALVMSILSFVGSFLYHTWLEENQRREIAGEEEEEHQVVKVSPKKAEANPQTSHLSTQNQPSTSAEVSKQLLSHPKRGSANTERIPKIRDAETDQLGSVNKTTTIFYVIVLLPLIALFVYEGMYQVVEYA